jgi:NADH pyrophosphatase NudC (nudix superfamily)
MDFKTYRFCGYCGSKHYLTQEELMQHVDKCEPRRCDEYFGELEEET